MILQYICTVMCNCRELNPGAPAAQFERPPRGGEKEEIHFVRTASNGL